MFTWSLRDHLENLESWKKSLTRLSCTRLIGSLERILITLNKTVSTELISVLFVYHVISLLNILNHFCVCSTSLFYYKLIIKFNNVTIRFQLRHKPYLKIEQQSTRGSGYLTKKKKYLNPWELSSEEKRFPINIVETILLLNWLIILIIYYIQSNQNNYTRTRMHFVYYCVCNYWLDLM